MASQTHGKGKKKNKEVVKVSLDEFNQIEAPVGHSVVSLKMTGLDWAATMANYDQQSIGETQQVIVPTAPRAQRGPGVDYESLPEVGPFRVTLYNMPMSMEEKDVERFFQGLGVKSVEISKQTTTVELSTRQDMYEALCKDGHSCKGKIIEVVMYGEMPKGDRYGARGGFGDKYGDRYGDKYGTRMGGGFGNRDRDGGFGSRDRDGGFGMRDRDGGFGMRDRDGGFNRGPPQRGFGERFSDRSQFSGGGEPDAEESTNWRARPGPPPAPAPSSYNNNGYRRPYMSSRPDSSQTSPAPSYNQPEPYYNSRYPPQSSQPPHHSPNSQYSNQSNDRSFPSHSAEERPKLVLSKRKTPLNIEENVSRNEAIFGQAKPSSTPYEKMKEVEEKLKGVNLEDKPTPAAP